MFRVFIVEDNQAMAATLSDLFAAIPADTHVVGTAASEMEATEWLQGNEGAWDLATIDLLLASGSGYNLIARCKAQKAAGAVVVLSDFATHGVAERCMVLGADAVFTKGDAKGLLAYVGKLAASRS